MATTPSATVAEPEFPMAMIPVVTAAEPEFQTLEEVYAYYAATTSKETGSVAQPSMPMEDFQGLCKIPGNAPYLLQSESREEFEPNGHTEAR